MKLPMNLQLFADDEIEVEDIEIETDEVEIDEVEEDTEESNETQEESEDTQEETQDESEEKQVDEVKDEHQHKTVPLSELMKERNKYKDRIKELESRANIAEKLAKMGGLQDVNQLQAEVEKYERENYIKKGVDPQMAQYLVSQQKEMQEVKQALTKQKRDLEFDSLKKSAFYSDAENYREELEELADKTGLSIQQAYNALRGEERAKEVEREAEQRVLNNLQKKQKTKVDTSSSGTQKPKSTVKLSQAELEMAKFAGMTPTEFYNMKNAKSLDQYQKLKKG